MSLYDRFRIQNPENINLHTIMVKQLIFHYDI